MRTHSFVSGFAAVALFFVGVVTAQQTATPPQQAQTQRAHDLSQTAHRLSKSAKTLDEFTEALRACGQVMQANPTPEQKSYIYKLASWTYNRRGETLVKLAEDAAATDANRAASYEASAAKDFGLAVQFDSDSWRPRFNRAVSVAILDDFRTALSDLDFVIRKQPAHKNALFNRAEILLQLGEYERAAADYASVLKLDPNDSAAHAGRGIAFSALGDTDLALQDLNAVVRLQPESAIAYVDRADLYAALGNWERAAGDYRVAIGLDGTNGRAYQNVAWLMATCPEERFRNPALSVRAAKKALELDGETYLGLDTYAAALASVGQYSQAAAAQQRAFKAAPAAEKPELAQRLALYQQQRPYVEKSVKTNIRLANAEKEAAGTTP